MMTLLAAGMLALLIVTALYAFGVFGTPYLGAFRFAFYLILIMVVVVMSTAAALRAAKPEDAIH